MVCIVKETAPSLSSVSNPFYNNTKGFSHHVLITIAACLTHSSSFLPGAFFSRPMWLWMGVAVVKTFNRNQESSFSMFLFDFSEAQLLKCHQKFLNLKIALTPKVHFVWRSRMLAPWNLYLFNGCWGRDIPIVGSAALIPTERAADAGRHLPALWLKCLL